MTAAIGQHLILGARRLWRDQKGQDLIEYAMLAASVALLVYGSLPSHFYPALSNIWGRVNNVLSTIGGA